MTGSCASIRCYLGGTDRNRSGDIPAHWPRSATTRPATDRGAGAGRSESGCVAAPRKEPSLRGGVASPPRSSASDTAPAPVAILRLAIRRQSRHSSQPRRRRTARTVDGHHCRPPCAVAVPLAFNSRAIWPRLLPAARSARMRCTSSAGSARGRPRVAGSRRPRAARRCSASCRSSSSTGTSFVPQGSSTISRNGSSRFSVERLIPSASAA